LRRIDLSPAVDKTAVEEPALSLSRVDEGQPFPLKITLSPGVDELVACLRYAATNTGIKIEKHLSLTLKCFDFESDL
jgi:hypothetical protein